MNRGFSFVFCLVATVVIALVSCQPEVVRPVSGVSLSDTEIELKIGKEHQLKAIIRPHNATDPSLIWYSDNEGVATVSDNGLVAAFKEGSARIYVETVDGGFTASCLVNVVPSYIAVQSVSLDKDSLLIVIGQTDTLTATVLPDRATDKSVSWSSSNPGVVTVNNGIITTVGLGDAVITVTTTDLNLTAQCFVSVVEPFVAVVPMQAERLPDMISGRADHVMYVSNGQLVVAGGHVNGFEITTSAEYLDNGEWHSIGMNYTHDMGFSVVLADGRLMLGGGCSYGSGVGQSSGVEIYNPASHSFEVMPSMTTSRTLCHAVQMADGNVLVSGNWYASDSKELYMAADSQFVSKGFVSDQRSTPYILRSSADNAIIFGPSGNYGGGTSLKVDRYSGDSFSVDLFEQWRPVSLPVNWRSADCATANYSYLIAARNEAEELGIMKVEGESFSMLETELPIPQKDGDTRLIYSGLIFTDQEHNTAYLPAYNGSVEAPVYYVLKVDYSAPQAHLTLYKTAVLDAYASIWSMTMLPDGRLVACGGIFDSNYTPYQTVWAFKPF